MGTELEIEKKREGVGSSGEEDRSLGCRGTERVSDRLVSSGTADVRPAVPGEWYVWVALEHSDDPLGTGLLESAHLGT